jgi:hypothetical protein
MAVNSFNISACCAIWLSLHEARKCTRSEKQNVTNCFEIRESRGDKSNGTIYLAVCNILWSDESVPMFRKNIPSPSSWHNNNRSKLQSTVYTCLGKVNDRSRILRCGWSRDRACGSTERSGLGVCLMRTTARRVTTFPSEEALPNSFRIQLRGPYRCSLHLYGPPYLTVNYALFQTSVTARHSVWQEGPLCLRRSRVYRF